MNHSPAARSWLRKPAWLLALCLLLPKAHADSSAPFDPRLLDAFVARPIGPANMGGRIVDVAVAPDKPRYLYVATASGGLWKTVNNGTTWTPVFDHQNTVSLGAVAVAASNSEVVWVGTGEANARNSVSWGDGVYRSSDGGSHWQHMGLTHTAHIGRIVIHPENPDIVYVAALGQLWGPNRQRGLYKTVDGGLHWEKVLYLDENTGCIDVALDPSEPDTLYAAAYQCRRDEFSGGNPKVQFGPTAGLYKTTDGGETWLQLTRGLPQRPFGRCGVAIYRKDPRILYAVIQTDRTDIRSVPGQGARTSNNPETGGIFRSVDKGQSWTKVNDLCPRPFYYGQIRIDPNDARRLYVLGVALYVSSDSGLTFQADGARHVHADHHALWIDPRDSDHLVLGGDGGLNFSYDRGATWEHLANLPVGQFYAVSVDLRKPYRIYGGLQDNGTWGGPSASRDRAGITNADWCRILAADGFQCQVDPSDADTVYAEGQYGNLQRVNVRTGVTTVLRPQAPRGAAAYRFNWNAPILLSPHNPQTVYFGGNHLLRSVDRGDHWEVLGPDLTLGKPGPSPDTGHTLTTIAESPRKAGLLYVGSDDGRVHVSHNGGVSWTDLSDRLPGLPPGRWITRLECSHFDAGTVYLAVDRHRQVDRRPYLFRSTDFGNSWEPLAHNLPAEGPVHVVREDPRNKELLFAGTEFGLFTSLDRGGSWYRLGKGLPTVAVADLVIHPRDRDLIIATHGRSIYILPIGPLEELTRDVLAADAHLFDIQPATEFYYRISHGHYGSKTFTAPNPPYGARICYYLKASAARPVSLTVQDALGKVVAELPAAGEQGLHSVSWELNHFRSTGEGGNPAVLVSPGDYVVRLKVGGQVLAKKVHVEAEEGLLPARTAPAIAAPGPRSNRELD